MAKFVTKKDGSRIAFDKEKITSSIMAAALDVELPQEEASKVANEVADLVCSSLEGQEEATTTEIRDNILTELDVLAPAVAEAWRHYEEVKGQ